MKNITNFLTESSSLIDNWANEPSPVNFIEYNEGDKKFGELNPGDIVYLCDLRASKVEIAELKVSGKIRKYSGMFHLPIAKAPGSNISYLEFGPVRCGASFGEGRYYEPELVNDSSVCVNINNIYAFGTNRDVVLKISKSNIGEKIENIQNEIVKLQATVDDLISKLENLI